MLIFFFFFFFFYIMNGLLQFQMNLKMAYLQSEQSVYFTEPGGENILHFFFFVNNIIL